MGFKMIKWLGLLFIILGLSSCRNNSVEGNSVMVFKAFEITSFPSASLDKGYPTYHSFDNEKKVSSTSNNPSVKFVLHECERVHS